MSDLESRKKKISLMVKLYYERVPSLQNESLLLLTDKYVNQYLDTEYSIEEINNKIAEDVVRNGGTQKKEESAEEKTLVEEKPKTLQKTENPVHYEAGYVHNLILSTVAFIVFTIACCLLIIFYFINL